MRHSLSCFTPCHAGYNSKSWRQVAGVVVALGIGAAAQTHAVARDSGAVAQAQAALVASGGAASVICLSGTATVSAKGSGTLSYPLRACISGSSSRVDATLPSGVRSRVVNGGLGAIRQPDGRVQTLRFRNTLYEQPIYLPGLLLAGLLNDPGRSVRSQSNEIDFPSESPLGPLRKDMHERAKVHVVLDSSGRVERASWRESGEQYEDDDGPVEVNYRDYGPLNGLIVPRTVEEHIEGHLSFELHWSSVDLSPALPADFFSVPSEGGQK